jgi:hypothetical protein
MASKNELDITINEDGSVDISVNGAKGKDCLDLTKFLEDELGVVSQRTHTSEYYQEEVTQEETIKVGE